MGAYFVVVEGNNTWQWFFKDDYADDIAQSKPYTTKDACYASIRDIQNSASKPIYPPQSQADVA